MTIVIPWSVRMGLGVPKRNYGPRTFTAKEIEGIRAAYDEFRRDPEDEAKRECAETMLGRINRSVGNRENVIYGTLDNLGRNSI